MKRISTFLVIAGALLVCNSLYMQAKAELAQILINHTWHQRQQSERPAKPWPWADTRAVALLEVPSLKVKRYIMQDASGESLAFGPGLMTTNALPAGQRHSIIAGHRDSHFQFMRKLKIGDRLSVTNFQGQRRAYKIVERRVINSNHEDLLLSENAGLLTLVTCYPFDQLNPDSPLRLIINAVTS